MVVITLDGSVRLAGAEAVERGEQRLLRPRLSRRAGDADDAGAAARARCGAKRVQRRGAVGNADMWMGDGRFTQDAGGAGGDRLGGELVPAGYLALPRDEQVALRTTARAQDHPLYRCITAGGAPATRERESGGWGKR